MSWLIYCIDTRQLRLVIEHVMLIDIGQVTLKRMATTVFYAQFHRSLIIAETEQLRQAVLVTGTPTCGNYTTLCSVLIADLYFCPYPIGIAMHGAKADFNPVPAGPIVSQ